MTRQTYDSMIARGQKAALATRAFQMTEQLRGQLSGNGVLALRTILSFNELPGLTTQLDAATILARIPAVKSRLMPPSKPVSLLDDSSLSALTDEALVDYATDVFIAQKEASGRQTALQFALQFYQQTNGDPTPAEFAATVDSFITEIEADLTEL